MFITTTGRGTAAHKETVARWVKDVLRAAKIPVCYGPASCRSASSSMAMHQVWSLEEVLARGHWKSSSVFFNHYCRDVASFQQHPTTKLLSSKQIQATQGPGPTNPLARSAKFSLRLAVARKCQRGQRSSRKIPYTHNILTSALFFGCPSTREADLASETMAYSEAGSSARLAEVEDINAPPASLPSSARKNKVGFVDFDDEFT